MEIQIGSNDSNPKVDQSCWDGIIPRDLGILLRERSHEPLLSHS